MTNETRPTGLMGKLVLTYLVALVVIVALYIAVVWALATYTNVSFPFGVVLIIVPMFAAMQSGAQYFKHAQSTAGFGYSFNFGIIAALLLMVAIVALAMTGQINGILRQIDPSSFDSGDLMKPLAPMLIVVGALGLFCNTLMFWAATKGQANQKLRKERLAARKN